MKSYGVDTSVLLRLVMEHPVKDFETCLAGLELIKQREPGTPCLASNQVIGEAYIALQYHYKLTKNEARDALRECLSSGYVEPESGEAVLQILAENRGPGTLDRLIAQGYSANQSIVLTRDRKMSRLPGVQLLSPTI